MSGCSGSALVGVGEINIRAFGWQYVAMYEQFAVENVLLDEENPRFADHVDSQPAAIRSLLAEDPSKLLNLAADIAQTGMLDPINPPYVARIDDDIIVLEGNRRFAALKLLRNHDLADDVSTGRKLARIVADAKAAGQTGLGPNEVTCYVANNREQAKRWIELRHTGEADGVGIRRWNTYQSNSFRRKLNTAVDWAWLLVQRVISDFEDDAELVEDVRAVRDEKLTNLARLIGTASIRTSLRLDITSERVIYKARAEFMHDLFKVLFSDLRSEGVGAIFTEADRRTYVLGLLDVMTLNPDESDTDADVDPDAPTEPVVSEDEQRDKQNGDRAPEAHASSTDEPAVSEDLSPPVLPNPPIGSTGSGDEKPAAPQPSGVTPPTPKSRASSLKGEPKIFRGMILKHVDDRTRKLLKQAQVPKIDTSPAVAAVMVRVILELVVTEVGENQGWTKEKKTLSQKIRACLLGLDPDCENPTKRDKQLEMAWVTTQKSGGDGLGVEELNAYVHNFMADPTPEGVRSLTRDFKYFITELDKHLGEKRK